ncbi:uncharacterized protein K460DRAFT_369232 [Cucurbitaria berberidis CBS 394.84]|uniref:Uncharacterized protein n=1 Tax=Cucurbitaria berberidis CBS 394.84 TaxID=1168544 RepID=A0A9P4GF12_9PLEO|nr:uncharacterized protein K460DRAFT_369232 [Cucurbitaria berberidis CBS 394.84]KAF1844365.1 hypothetical protein K460DRAFT_369232 [Cucurbitaria berberidis CBS 394.84]
MSEHNNVANGCGWRIQKLSSPRVKDQSLTLLMSLEMVGACLSSATLLLLFACTIPALSE